MRAVVQRVTLASVTVAGEVVGTIGPGLCVLVGVTHTDGDEAADRLADKLWNLRIFEDETGRANRSAADLGREVLVVSQFTLYADASRGRRPSFVAAAPPEQAAPLVDRVASALTARGARVAVGRFREQMSLSLTNDGPFTILLDS
ncbi:MAG TPA: D-aminoacyl-tRNA deacylase [Acidimicrobiales bacterium]|nr:D-aminoacyl-tRNA deacylase [Acidimicrobiales bacterium]